MTYGLKSTNQNKWTNHVIAKVKETLSRLYDKLAAFKGANLPVPKPSTSLLSKVRMGKKGIGELRGNSTIFEIRKTSHAQLELDRYQVVKMYLFTQQFDLVGWWKFKANNYPIFREIAHSILAIHFSTVPSIAHLQHQRCIMGPFWSLLFSSTFEILIRIQNLIKRKTIHILNVIDFEEA